MISAPLLSKFYRIFISFRVVYPLFTIVLVGIKAIWSDEMSRKPSTVSVSSQNIPANANLERLYCLRPPKSSSTKSLI